MSTSPDRRARRYAVLLLRVLELAAVCLSAAAAVDSYVVSHAFCARGAGCDVVRASEVGRFLSGALPALGVIGYGLVFLLSLSRSARVQRVALAAAVSGGVGGLALLLLQRFVIQALCPLCVGVDSLGVAIAALAIGLVRGTPLAVPAARANGLWHAALFVCAGLPFAYALTRPVPVPEYVHALAKPGMVTVVELSDFECPFCRAMHPVLKSVLAEHERRVQLVRWSIPLPGHLHARDAARAYVCAGAQGRGDQMADVLFSARGLTAQDCAHYASSLALDTARYARCVADPATDALIDEHIARVRAGGFEGLPTVWIGEQRLIGFDRNAGGARYEAAIGQALRGQSGALRRVLPWLLLLLGAALGLVWGRKR